MGRANPVFLFVVSGCAGPDKGISVGGTGNYPFGTAIRTDPPIDPSDDLVMLIGDIRELESPFT